MLNVIWSSNRRTDEAEDEYGKEYEYEYVGRMMKVNVNVNVNNPDNGEQQFDWERINIYALWAGISCPTTILY
ncbi:hypothetical protein WAI453_003417 [Rhynchosporium graminicola]